MTAQCPEAIIGDDGFVIQCGRDGGHKGKHVIVTDRGIAEWPRIEATPLADWERELICRICGASCCHRDHEIPF